MLLSHHHHTLKLLHQQEFVLIHTMNVQRVQISRICHQQVRNLQQRAPDLLVACLIPSSGGQAAIQLASATKDGPIQTP